MSQALTHLAKIEQARTLAESVLADARKLGNSFKIGYALIPLTLVAILEEEYDVSMVMAQECADMWQETGHYMFLGQALALSGFAACELDNFIAAQQFFTQAVEMGKTRLTILPLLYALPGIALLFAKQGKYEQAIELYAAASCHPHVANSLWFATVVGKQITAAASTLAPKVFTAAAACGRTRDLWTTATELLTVLQSGKQLQSGFPLNPATVALPKRNVMSDEVNKDNNDLRASI